MSCNGNGLIGCGNCGNCGGCGLGSCYWTLIIVAIVFIWLNCFKGDCGICSN